MRVYFDTHSSHDEFGSNHISSVQQQQQIEVCNRESVSFFFVDNFWFSFWIVFWSLHTLFILFGSLCSASIESTWLGLYAPCYFTIFNLVSFTGSFKLVCIELTAFEYIFKCHFYCYYSPSSIVSLQ